MLLIEPRIRLTALTTSSSSSKGKWLFSRPYKKENATYMARTAREWMQIWGKKKRCKEISKSCKHETKGAVKFYKHIWKLGKRRKCLALIVCWKLEQILYWVCLTYACNFNSNRNDGIAKMIAKAFMLIRKQEHRPYQSQIVRQIHAYVKVDYSLRKVHLSYPHQYLQIRRFMHHCRSIFTNFTQGRCTRTRGQGFWYSSSKK